jgi:S-(hydroxymethyl)glutathione dehydrogenase/alcohol dehydrogenase
LKTRAAVLWGPDQDWKIEEVTMDGPGPGEVLVQLKACGLCHSDEHVHSGDLPVPHFPFIGGHEGAAEVLEVGAGVTTLAPGDHVAFSFVPACGRCTWCARGVSYLCDEGSKLFNIGMMTDDRIAHTIGDTPVARFAQLGAFSEQQLLSEHSLVKVDADVPWHAVALVSCGVATGYGSAVDRAGTQPGDVVVVVGVGGVGVSAVQGARIAGASRIIAIDPLESRREASKQFGATDAFASMEEALLPVLEMTKGVMADRVILTPSVIRGSMIEPALQLTRKAGVCVVTAIGPMLETDTQLNLFMLSMMNKSLVGTVYGSSNPRERIPFLLELYKQGQLKLDEMVSRSYPLEQVNQGYADQAAGTITRGVLTF